VCSPLDAARIVGVETGDDNLAATFTTELSDLAPYVGADLAEVIAFIEKRWMRAAG
jgi:hypothetical protein